MVLGPYAYVPRFARAAQHARMQKKALIYFYAAQENISLIKPWGFLLSTYVSTTHKLCLFIALLPFV